MSELAEVAAGAAAPARSPARPWVTSLRRQRRWRAWLVIALVIIAGGTIIALLQRPPANAYLNPDSTGPTGTHALADVLTKLGHNVVITGSAQSAIGSAAAGSTLVVTSPDYLTGQQLAALGRTPADVLLVEPTAIALKDIAPSVELIGSAEPVLVTQPHCGLRAATLAGSAYMGGENLLVVTPEKSLQECYSSTSGPTLVQFQAHGRLVTVLGTGAPLTNADLASEGNAALAINLLPTHTVVWLTPPVAPLPAASAAQKTFFGLVPLAAYLVLAQLAAALLLTIAWRARRLGPLVAEPLPVVVRASETVEGHGRLYEARHTRDKAAEVLRAAALGKLTRAAGLPRGADSAAVVTALAERSSLGEARITELLYGPAPETDRALLALARDLDELEHEVTTT
jgi:hypothetical protein